MPGEAEEGAASGELGLPPDGGPRWAGRGPSPAGARMEYVLFVLYFSFFLCLCALVCLYFSGCQEMTYRHEGKRRPLAATRGGAGLPRPRAAYLPPPSARWIRQERAPCALRV